MIRLPALMALAVALYLAGVGLTTGSVAGCAAGSSCGVVLASAWSKVLGWPVSALAALAYLGVLTGSLRVGVKHRENSRHSAWTLLLFFASAIIASALWFTALQAFVIGHWCVYCMTSHTLGMLASGVILASAPVHKKRWLIVALLGVCVAASMAVVQTVFPGRQHIAVRLGTGYDTDTGQGTHRTVTFLGGQVRLAPAEMPMIGSPDARHVMLCLFDYTCPHCRTMHAYLERMIHERAGEFAVVMLPMPLDARCNPTLTETEPYNRNACELAKIGLAVFRASPDDREPFARFTQFMYEHESPREVDESMKQAERLVGKAALENALTDPWIHQQIQKDVFFFGLSKLNRLPAVLIGRTAMLGRPATYEEFVREVEESLKPAETGNTKDQTPMAK